MLAGLSEEEPEEDEEDVLAANTSEMEDMTVALGALADYATTLRGDFAPFVAQIMPIALGALSVRESYEVREVSLSAGKLGAGFADCASGCPAVSA